MSFGYEYDYGIKLRADADTSKSFVGYVTRRLAGGHALPAHIAKRFHPATQTPNKAKP